jgi:hypothetical protein
MFRAMQKRNAADSVVFGSKRPRSEDEVAHLIDRIRTLVAQQRRLEASPDSEGHEANRREIDRLRERLAIAVKQELRHHDASGHGDSVNRTDQPQTRTTNGARR